MGASILVALVAGCATVQQQQFQSSLSSLTSEKCRALEAVIYDRQRYGIVAASEGPDEAVLQRCRLEPPSAGAGPEPHAADYPPYVTSSPAMLSTVEKGTPPVGETVSLERRGRTYLLPVRINQTITLPFILDTGATDLVIPADVALTLVRAGALTSGDFIGKSRSTLANGSEEVGDRVLIREAQVGHNVVRNVTAIVNPPASDLLLGQSFLSKFGSVTVDYKRLVLILSP